MYPRDTHLLTCIIHLLIRKTIRHVIIALGDIAKKYFAKLARKCLMCVTHADESNDRSHSIRLVTGLAFSAPKVGFVFPIICDVDVTKHQTGKSLKTRHDETMISVGVDTAIQVVAAESDGASNMNHHRGPHM